MTEFDVLPAAAYRFECPICGETLVSEGDLSGDCINCHREFEREETVEKLVTLQSVRDHVRSRMDEAAQNHEIDRVIGIFRELLTNFGSTQHEVENQ